MYNKTEEKKKNEIKSQKWSHENICLLFKIIDTLKMYQFYNIQKERDSIDKKKIKVRG
jgi:hypothetical protein